MNNNEYEILVTAETTRYHLNEDIDGIFSQTLSPYPCIQL